MHGSPLHSEGEKWIQNAYEAHKQGKGLLQECHRESGKTTVFSKFFLAFRIGHEPHKVNMVIRINDDKANETTEAVANIIANDPRWKMIFPHVVPDMDKGWGAGGYEVKDERFTPEQWSMVVTERPDMPSFVGYGWKSGSIIGSRVNGVLIIDDIHDENNTSSDRQLAAVKKFYTDTLEFCVMDGAWEIWNFTPWLTNDLYAHAKATGEYLHSKTPVMVAAKEGDDGATFWETDARCPLSNGWWKLYWPEVWGFDRIAKKYRKTGALGFARMMLLDLEATKGLHLKMEWLHEYPAKEINPSWPVIMGNDYASTADKLRDKDRDYFTLAIFRAIPGGGIVLVDGYRGKISKGEALEVVAGYAGIYPTLVKIGVENIGKGEEFYNDLLLTNDLNGKPMPLMSIKHGRKSKGDRFENWLAPRFQAGRVWVSDTPTPFIQAFRNEWALWPNAEHDDTLDAVYMGAFAAEGYMPSKAERTHGHRKEKQKHPAYAFARR
jgi:phage terminase large subunit-like protein